MTIHRCESCETTGADLWVCACGLAEHDYCAEESGWTLTERGERMCPNCSAAPYVVRAGETEAKYATAQRAVAALSNQARAFGRAELLTDGKVIAWEGA